jgi:hypothetical protein
MCADIERDALTVCTFEQYQYEISGLESTVDDLRHELTSCLERMVMNRSLIAQTGDMALLRQMLSIEQSGLRVGNYASRSAHPDALARELWPQVPTNPVGYTASRDYISDEVATSIQCLFRCHRARRERLYRQGLMRWAAEPTVARHPLLRTYFRSHRAAITFQAIARGFMVRHRRINAHRQAWMDYKQRIHDNLPRYSELADPPSPPTDDGN